MRGAKLNVNLAWAITWFVGVTIFCTFFNSNSPLPRQFLCNKILLKKKSYSKGNLLGQSFKLRGPKPPDHICTSIAGCFQDKTVISTENIRLDIYLLLKYCRRQCPLLSLPGPYHLQNLIPKCKILDVFWT